MPDPRRDYFFDTVALSNFALTGRLDLLVSRHGRHVQITQEVLDEVADGIIAGYSALCEIEEAIADARFTCAGSPALANERGAYLQMLRVLAPGEASCIACAKHRRGIVVTDDKTARDCCKEQGVKYTGTIGILKACCQAGTLSADEADALLKAMIDAGYYSPVQRISDLNL